MDNKRKFIIKVIIFNPKFPNGISKYIKKIYLHKLGYYCSFTSLYEKNAKKWKSKKCCENAIKKIQQNLDITKHHYKFEMEILEITDIKTLRYLKLKKLKK